MPKIRLAVLFESSRTECSNKATSVIPFLLATPMISVNFLIDLAVKPRLRIPEIEDLELRPAQKRKKPDEPINKN